MPETPETPPPSGDGSKPTTISVTATVEGKEKIEQLQTELSALKTEKTALQTKYDQAIADKTATEEAKADLEAQLAELSRQELEKEKEKLVAVMKEAKVPDEKIKFVQDKIQTPADLERVNTIVTDLVGMIKAAQTPETPETPTPPAKPTGRATLPPTPTTPVGFENAKAMVDDLYDRAAKGDKEAERQLKKLWEQWGIGEKKQLTRLSISECLGCHAGIPTDAAQCPFCGWKKSKGME